MTINCQIIFSVQNLYNNPSWQSGDSSPCFWHQSHTCHLIGKGLVYNCHECTQYLAVPMKMKSKNQPGVWVSELVELLT